MSGREGGKKKPLKQPKKDGKVRKPTRLKFLLCFNRVIFIVGHG